MQEAPFFNQYKDILMNNFLNQLFIAGLNLAADEIHQTLKSELTQDMKDNPDQFSNKLMDWCVDQGYNSIKKGITNISFE